MKMLKTLTTAALITCVLGAPLGALAVDQKSDSKAKPYTLKTCIVSGEKLGEMGSPYVFVHEGREIKLCCKNCLKDFNKEPAKYVKKIEDAEKKAKKQS